MPLPHAALCEQLPRVGLASVRERAAARKGKIQLVGAARNRGSTADRSSVAAELQGKITRRHLLGLSNPRAPPPLTVL